MIMEKNKIVDSILEYSRNLYDADEAARTMETQTHEMLGFIYELNIQGSDEDKYECIEAELYYLRIILDKMKLQLNEIKEILDDKSFLDGDE